jgi:hypothetical protein
VREARPARPEAPSAPPAVLGVGPGEGDPLPEGGSGVSPPRKF